MRTTGRVSTWQLEWLSQRNTRSNFGQDRTLDPRLRQAPRLLVERSRWDGEEHHRTDDRGEDVCGRASGCILPLLPRLRGPEEPPVHLPNPSRPTRQEVPSFDQSSSS